MKTNREIQQRSIPYLPTELRLQIWKELASIPRVLTIDFSRDEHLVRPCIEIDGVIYSQASVLFFVSHETRRIALETYRVRVYLQFTPGSNWLLAEADRLLLKDIGWGWHTYGWGTGKYFFSGGTRHFMRQADPGAPQPLLYKLITEYAEGPRPSWATI
ncbi:hypothetical protein PG994_001433 [Apiospora phragmitis]|uniref:2EXR domain-containing protein n=1 Tax=Apiospora phragmitis TaxID=2905665 RepID=A0ABR1WTJ2_9PEZI